MMSRTNNFTLLQWNVRGYRPQRPYIQHAIDIIKPQIICIQETHLKPNQTASFTNFNASYRKDREKRKGGGVAIFVKNTINSVPIKIDTDLEITAALIFWNSQEITICNIYLPPDQTIQDVEKALEAAKNILGNKFIITIDTNAHHPDWGSPNSDSRGNLISRWVHDNSFILLNSGEPTFMSNTGSCTHIDITVCSANIASSLDWKPHHDLLNSDHFPLVIGGNEIDELELVQDKWNMKSADWNLFQQILLLPENFKSPDEACSSFTEAIVEAANKAIKKRSNNINRPSAYWWNAECSKTKREKNKKLTRYKNHRGNIELWIEFKKAKAYFRKAVNKAKKESWENFLDNFTRKMTTTLVWKHLKMLRNKPSSRNIVLKDGDKYLHTPIEVANALAFNFSQQSSGVTEDEIFRKHKAESEKSKIIFSEDYNNEDYNRLLTLTELKFALSSCSSKSPGPDTLPYLIIQNFNEHQLHKLLQFLNYIFETGYPSQWKEGIIIPLPKPNKPRTNVDSYRPITLTNCLSKLLEKIINRRLQYFLESNNYYSQTQSGFRNSHSTLDGLLRFQHSAQTAINESKFCVAVFLDIKKAFDTVWHQGLLSKLKNIGLKGNLAKFIQQFLTNRKISVQIANTKSNKFPLVCGVPQGSVLSPTLFTILINDLFSEVSSVVSTSLFADDGALWIVSDDLTEALKEMQDALDIVTEWSHTWGLQISHAKTNALIITKRNTRSPVQLKLEDKVITYVTSMKFLGVTFDSRLTWGTHIKNIHEKCQKDIQLMRVISYNKWSSDYTTLLRIYKSLILPKIDYASFLYINTAKTHKLKLDRIQYAASRIILGALRCTANYKLEAEANIMPLEYRRESLLMQYGSRITRIKSHPVTEYLQQHRPIYIYMSGNYKLSALALLHKNFECTSSSINNVSKINMKNFYNTKTYNIKSTLADVPKQNRSDIQWRALYSEMIEENYKDRSSIFTDGSCKQEKSGYGIYCSKVKIMGRLSDKTSIFTTELYAIYKAIKYISNLQGNFILLTDSLSCIKALQSLDTSKHYLLSYIKDELDKVEETKVYMEWVPSHMCITGNENADSLANVARTLPDVEIIPRSKLEMRRCVRATYKNAWEVSWSALPLSLRRFKPSIEVTAFSDKERFIQLPISRLRLNATQLNKGHYAKKESAARCDQCSCVMSLTHLLIDCPVFNGERQEIINHCVENNISLNLYSILSPPFPIELTYKYLCETDFIKKI